MSTSIEQAIPKLEAYKMRYEELTYDLSKNEIINNNKLYRELTKEYAFLQPIVDQYERYKTLQKQKLESEDILQNESNKDLKEMAKEELILLNEEITKVELEVKTLLIPHDPLADKNIIVEIRAGTGGEEAALFVGDLFRMYSRFAEKKGWNYEMIDANETGIGGYKEVVFSITGKRVFENLRFESGGHRVQRIPQTESSGRIHTSAVTVAVLPEAEETDIEIRTEDLRIDTYRAGGAGGQHVNKTDSAVRITHAPSGIVVQCQKERSQLKNKNLAMTMLRSKLLEQQIEAQNSEIAEMRKGQVGTGDRSDKVRTYNYPQNRVTDHRIGVTLYNLESFMNGEIEDIINPLKLAKAESDLKD